MRILVTGAGGFVGHHLMPRLAAAGHDAVGRDREMDVTDPEAVDAVIQEVAPEAVIHLAAQASGALSHSASELTFRVNFLGSAAVLEGVRRCAPTARVLWIGSGEVYGLADPDAPPFGERAPLRPRSPYGWSKACADLLAGQMTRAAGAARSLDIVRVRPFNHTGPGQADAFVLPSFTRQLCEIASGRHPARLRVGNLDSVRDFLDVEDVVDAYLRLLDPAVPVGVYNVASGVGRRIGDLLEVLMRRVGVRPEIEVDPERLRPADRAVGDASRLRDATGWTPAVPLEVTLDRLVEHWRTRGAG